MKKKLERPGQGSNPENILELLVEKLSRRGVLFAQTPRFVKDVLNIIADDRSSTEMTVNQKLGRLGWEEHILDGYILELIRFLAENLDKPSPHITAAPLPLSPFSPCGSRVIGEVSSR